MENNNETAPIYIIEEDITNINTSRIWPNYTINSTFRSDQRIMLNASLHDQFYNLRNQSYYTANDTVTYEVYYKNDFTGLDVLESTNTMLPQTEADGTGYYHVYTVKYVSSNYYIKPYINGELYTRH